MQRIDPETTCWILTDGKQGMENQCLGLAEAMGLPPVVKRIAIRQPWRDLLPYFRLGIRYAPGPAGDPVDPPWPDLAISCGRQGLGAALALRRRSEGRSFIVHIQDPVISPRHFDLVVAPAHDGIQGPNVLTTIGSLHRVKPERLREDALRHADRLAFLPHPRAAVLIGGRSRAYRMSADDMETIAGQLARLAGDQGAGLMITTSRRTGPECEAILRERLSGLPAEIWDGTGENPYFAYLGLADAILVTPDSVNMVCEAASTGKPVHVIELPGGNEKFRRFHRNMVEAGITRPFMGRIESWTYPPLRETERIAEEVWRRLAEHRQPVS